MHFSTQKLDFSENPIFHEKCILGEIVVRVSPEWKIYIIPIVFDDFVVVNLGKVYFVSNVEFT